MFTTLVTRVLKSPGVDCLYKKHTLNFLDDEI